MEAKLIVTHRPMAGESRSVQMEFFVVGTIRQPVLTVRLRRMNDSKLCKNKGSSI